MSEYRYNLEIIQLKKEMEKSNELNTMLIEELKALRNALYTQEQPMEEYEEDYIAPYALAVPQMPYRIIKDFKEE